eukprot:scaffold22313_cov40-Prasinocladus_malaysianus.AAC.1
MATSTEFGDWERLSEEAAKRTCRLDCLAALLRPGQAGDDGCGPGGHRGHPAGLRGVRCLAMGQEARQHRDGAGVDDVAAARVRVGQVEERGAGLHRHLQGTQAEGEACMTARASSTTVRRIPYKAALLLLSNQGRKVEGDTQSYEQSITS